MIPDYRQEWKDQGKLFLCPNKSHNFTIGKLVAQVTWASDCWSDVTATGTMNNYGLCICSINNLSGTKGWKVIIWKLSILFGVLK